METVVSFICSASSNFMVSQELSHYSLMCNKHHRGEETGRVRYHVEFEGAEWQAEYLSATISCFGDPKKI
jgi:hypothetical protein